MGIALECLKKKKTVVQLNI